MARLDDETLLGVGGSLEFSIRPGRSRSDLEIQRISNLVEEENADMDVARPGKPCSPLYTEGIYFQISNEDWTKSSISNFFRKVNGEFTSNSARFV